MTYDPSTRSLPEMERDLIAFAMESETTGLAWAGAEALKDQLDDMRRVVLSDSMPSEGSFAQKEADALKSEPYKKHLQGLYEARKDANEKKVRYIAAQAKLEAIRTLLSNKRELLKRGIE